MVQLSHSYTTVTLTRWTFVGKVLSLLFNALSLFVIAFNFKAAVIICSDLEAQDKKICHSFPFFSIYHEMMGSDTMILVFLMLSFKPAFPLSSFILIKRLFSSSSLSAVRVVLSAYLRLLI